MSRTVHSSISGVGGDIRDYGGDEERGMID